MEKIGCFVFDKKPTKAQTAQERIQIIRNLFQISDTMAVIHADSKPKINLTTLRERKKKNERRKVYIKKE